MKTYTYKHPRINDNDDYNYCVSLIVGKRNSTLIDVDDFDSASKIYWQLKTKGKSSYVVNHRKSAKQKGEKNRLHRFLFNSTDSRHVDHINHDTLDNRKRNLRLCTHAQNCMNSAKRQGSSKYKGVSLVKKTGKWTACINVKGKTLSIGRFEKEEDAAYAYNLVALLHYGEFANLNIIDGYPELSLCSVGISPENIP